MPRPNDVGVGVSVLIVRGDEVLLGLRKGAHGAGTWSAPGVWIDRADASIEAACAREPLEEAGIRLTGPTRRVCEHAEDYPERGFRAVTLFRLATGYEGEPRVLEPDKCEEWRWFPLDAPPSPLFGGVGEAIRIVIARMDVEKRCAVAREERERVRYWRRVAGQGGDGR